MTVTAMDSKLRPLFDRRRLWGVTPYSYNPEQLPEGYLDTVHRIIALGLALELPVGELAREGIDRVGPQYHEALSINASDESRHLDVFSALSEVSAPPVEYLAFAQEAATRALQSPEHPLAVAGWLELTVFLVSLSILRSTRQVGLAGPSGDISADESRHVRTNLGILDWEAIPITRSVLEPLRVELIDFMVESLPVEEATRFRGASESLRDRRTSDLTYTKAPLVPAFLEVAATNLGQYDSTERQGAYAYRMRRHR